MLLLFQIKFGRALELRNIDSCMYGLETDDVHTWYEG